MQVKRDHLTTFIDSNKGTRTRERGQSKLEIPDILMDIPRVGHPNLCFCTLPSKVEMGKPTETGLEAVERLCFLASFPLPGTGKREGGKKTQPFNRFACNPVTARCVQRKPKLGSDTTCI